MDRKAVDIPIGIGEDTQIRKAIVDKGARIGKNVLVGKIQETINDSFARLANTTRSAIRVLTQPISGSCGRSRVSRVHPKGMGHLKEVLNQMHFPILLIYKVMYCSCADY